MANGIPPLPERSTQTAPPAGAVPAPAPQSQAEPQPQEGFQPSPMVQPDDTRYGDPGWVVIADIVFQGAMPWLMAAADVAQGRVQSDQYDEARQEHQTRINTLKEEHPEFVKSAEEAVPFLAGLGFGAAGTSRSIATNIGRGATAGGAAGFVSGFTGGDTETPSFSSERVGEGMGKALPGAAMGGAGGAAGAAAGKVVGKMANRGAEQQVRRAETERRNQEFYERRRGERQQQAQQTEQRRQPQGQQQQQQQPARSAPKAPEDLQQLWRTQYVKSPRAPAENWRTNREEFMRDPETAFYAAADASPSLQAFSRATNLPPAVIASNLSDVNLDLDSPSRRRLFNELADVLEAKEVVRARGRGSDNPGTTSNAGTTGRRNQSAQSANRGRRTDRSEQGN